MIVKFACFVQAQRHPKSCKMQTGMLEKMGKTQVMSFSKLLWKRLYTDPLASNDEEDIEATSGGHVSFWREYNSATRGGYGSRSNTSCTLACGFARQEPPSHKDRRITIREILINEAMNWSDTEKMEVARCNNKTSGVKKWCCSMVRHL